MNSRVVGILLIGGAILTLGMWIGLSGSIDTEGKTASEAIDLLTKNEALARVVSFVAAVGLTAMFLGLFFFARSLKSDNTTSNTYAEIGGLILLLILPVIGSVQFGSVAAIENASDPAVVAIMLDGSRTLGNDLVSCFLPECYL